MLSSRSHRYKDVLKIASQTNLWNTLRLLLGTNNDGVRVIVSPGVHVGLGRHVTLSGPGRLFLGLRWQLSRYMNSELKLLVGAKLEVNGTFQIYTGCSISVNPDATLSLHSGYINNNLRLDCFERISIGSQVAIAKNVSIRDSDTHSIQGGTGPTAPIEIQDRVWIGMNATILKGVTIGEGAVVGANALVTRDVPPRTLVGGVPARVIKENITWK